jgi:DUF1680 family protein
MTQSRRTFLKTTTAAAVATAVLPRKTFSAETPTSEPLTQFPYADVQLLPGPLRQQFDTNHAFYAALSEDALLKPFRLRAGLPTPGEDMGGWYDWVDGVHLADGHGFCPGHSFGQMLSGLARDYAATGNKATQAKVQRLVAGYAPAISAHFNEGNRFPAYTYDKVSIGLLDAHTLAADPNALPALNAALDAVEPFLPAKALSRDEQYARPHQDDSFCWDEFYTLPENFLLAYQRGAGDRYRSMGQRFLADDWYFNPLAAGENVLPGKHAYSHCNALSSAAMAYYTLGSDKHLRAAQNGFDFIRAQSFATGGWGPDEQFRDPASGDLGKSLTSTHSSFETPCGAYAHFKITRYLMRVTRDSRYGDSMERVLYNTILGVKPIRTNGYGFYYSDYNNDATKVYREESWCCCTGTFAQITADYGISAYFRDANAVYVNLFVPSRVTWGEPADRVTLTQKTSYPHHPTTQIEVSCARSAVFPLYVRIPAWAGPKTRVAVNGKLFSSATNVAPTTGPVPGEFYRIERAWKNGDRLEVEFDMPTVLEPVDKQHPNLMATVHGPLALFAVGPIPEKLRREDLLAATQVAASSEDWQANTPTGKLTLRPFTAIQDEHYRLYLPIEG